MERIDELDGLRGLAIALVVLGHVVTGIGPYPRPGFGPSLAPYADLVASAGVQLFFALSGFLITSLLLRQVGRDGGVALRSFWLRRLRRLYPPLIVVAVAYVATMAVLPWTRGEAWTGHPWAGLGDVAMSLTYTSNFAWLFVPYSGWLGHTWSLAVEEQFYLAWPLVIAGVYRWRTGRGLVPIILASVVVVTILRVPGPGWADERLLRWDALLLGSLVAVLGWRTPRWLTWSALGVFAVLCAVDSDLSAVFYSGTALTAALLVGGAHHLGWLRQPVLVHLGYISYSLYLWHVFVLRFAPPWWLALLLSLVIAELGYLFVERRFMAHPPPLRRVIDLRSTRGPAPTEDPARESVP